MASIGPPPATIVLPTCLFGKQIWTPGSANGVWSLPCHLWGSLGKHWGQWGHLALREITKGLRKVTEGLIKVTWQLRKVILRTWGLRDGTWRLRKVTWVTWSLREVIRSLRMVILGLTVVFKEYILASQRLFGVSEWSLLSSKKWLVAWRLKDVNFDLKEVDLGLNKVNLGLSDCLWTSTGSLEACMKSLVALKRSLEGISLETSGKSVLASGLSQIKVNLVKNILLQSTKGAPNLCTVESRYNGSKSNGNPTIVDV